MPITAKMLQDARTGIEGIAEFLNDYRGPNNDNSGKYKMPLRRLQSLFKDSSWQHENKSSGHKKIKNLVTKVTIEYSAHKDPIDPGAVTTIANALQNHINTFFEGIMKHPSSQRKLKQNYDYQAIATRLNTQAR
ncbi:MAG: hypothetical protein ACSNEK_09945 [Parachlamydiaceae bacterium]